MGLYCTSDHAFGAGRGIWRMDGWMEYVQNGAEESHLGKIRSDLSLFHDAKFCWFFCVEMGKQRFVLRGCEKFLPALA